MSATSHWRGHAIHDSETGWRYTDTGEPVEDNPDRDCGHCGLPDTPEGHDGCLGTLPGVMNACCGHGVTGDAYVQFPDGTRIAGAEALRYQEAHRAALEAVPE